MAAHCPALPVLTPPSTRPPRSPQLQVIIDVHSEFFGTCDALEPTFKRLYTTYMDRPIKFFTATADGIATLKEKRAGKSQPLIQFWKDTRLVLEVEGCDTPKIVKAIHQHVPGED